MRLVFGRVHDLPEEHAKPGPDEIDEAADPAEGPAAGRAEPDEKTGEAVGDANPEGESVGARAELDLVKRTGGKVQNEEGEKRRHPDEAVGAGDMSDGRGRTMEATRWNHG